MTRVLVTGAGALLGQGIIRALRRASIAIEVAAVDPSPLAAGLYWTKESYLIPLADDPGYLDALRQVLASARPDVVLVGTDVELPVFAQHRASLEREFACHVLVSDPRVIAIADDKFTTFEFFRDAGFDAPLSALQEDQDAVARLIADVGFPLIVKPRVGARSIGVSTVHSRAELDAALKGREFLVVQQCVGSIEREFTASVLVFDGKARASIVMRRDLRDGNTYRAFSEGYPELNAIVREWGEALQPYGPANFQFRIGADGRPRVFEINARFSGATPLRALVGFNEVEMCVRHLLFDTPVKQPQVLPAAMLRHWSETFVPADELKKGS